MESDARRRPARWFTADYMFRGVSFAPCKHVVRFKYEPASFGTGVTIGSAAVIILIFIAFAYRRLGVERESLTSRKQGRRDVR